MSIENWEHKTSKIDLYLWFAAIFFITLVIFYGGFRNLAQGKFDLISVGYSLTGLIILFVEIWGVKKLLNARYGYDENGIFKVSIFTNKTIQWGSIKSIQCVHEMTERNWEDIFQVRKGMSIYKIVSNEGKQILIPQNHPQCHQFISHIEKKTGIELENRPKEFYNLIQNVLGG